ncbi:MAG: ribonucleotide-diphosphate reductase subunit alpha, partial [Pseudomonadota bacterium]
NKALEALLEEKSANTEETWTSILEHEGSVQHLDCLSEAEKSVFKTAFELDQRWVVELAADRSSYICQGQSVNVFLPGDIDKWDLHMLHWSAWEKGVKSLYYCRSKSVQRAAYAGSSREGEGASEESVEAAIQKAASERTDYDECLACQ